MILIDVKLRDESMHGGENNVSPVSKVYLTSESMHERLSDVSRSHETVESGDQGTRTCWRQLFKAEIENKFLQGKNIKENFSQR